MPSNVISTIAARAKAHHDSLNAAYVATYSPGSSPRSSVSNTPEASRQASTASEYGERNITKAWKALKKHHQEMNEAYSVFYAPGSSTASSRAPSAAPSRRASFEEARYEITAEQPRNYQKVWTTIKNKAAEHHRSVNAAADAMYGAKSSTY